MDAIYDFDPSSVIDWPQEAQKRLLPLQRGREIEVIENIGNGWAYGRLVGNPHVLGLFPTSYGLPMPKYQEMMQQAFLATEERMHTTKTMQTQGLVQQAPLQTQGLVQQAPLQTQGLAQQTPYPDGAKDETEEDGDCSQS